MARSQLDIIINLVDKGSKKNLDGMIKSLTAMGVALGAVKVAGDAWRAATQGAELKRAEKAFKDMAGNVDQNMDDIVDAMQRATGGALDMQTAMELASRAIKLGVATTPEEFAKLADSATRLGAAMGRGPVDAINDVVTGIGRMSPLILDNIGIVTNGGQVFDDYAKSLGKSAKELSDAEKKQALLNQTVSDGMKLGDANATGFEQMNAALTDLGNVIKKNLVPVLEPLARAIGDAARRTLELKENTELLTQAGWAQWQLDRMTAEQKAILANQIQTESDRWSGLAQHVLETTSAIEEVPTDIEIEAKLVGQEKIIQDTETLAGVLSKITQKIQQEYLFRARLSMNTLPETESGTGGLFQQHGGTFTVPPGYPNDSFPVRVSSGERVSVSNDQRNYFGGSTVNINNGTQLDAFEELLRTIQ